MGETGRGLLGWVGIVVARAGGGGSCQGRRCGDRA